MVTCSGLVGVLLALVKEYPDRSAGGDTRDKLEGPLLYLDAYLTPAVHVLALGFLIAEVSVLDPAAYRLPSWSNYWRHLS